MPAAIVFLHPERFWPLVALALVVLSAAVLMRRRSRGTVATGLSTAFRVALLAVVAAGAMEPAAVRERRSPGTLLVALDGSRSVLKEERARLLEEVLRSAAAEGVPVTLTLFGAEARVLAWREEAARVARDGSVRDLASRAGRGVAPLLLSPSASRSRGRLFLISDGALPEPRGLPVRKDLRPLVIPAGGRNDVLLRALALEPGDPPRVGTPLVLEATAAAEREVRAVARLFLDGRVVARPQVTLGPGTSRVRLSLPAVPPGRHVALVRFTDVTSPAGPIEDEPADNGAACAFRVRADPFVLFVCDEERPILAVALKAQGLDVRVQDAATFAASPGEPEPAVLVFDRISSARLSEPALLDRVRMHLEAGGGLLYLPREERGELYGEEEKPFLKLLPLLGRKPPPPPSPEEKPPDDSSGLRDPDPEARKKVRRKAPTLGLVLVIDVSSSMREGGRLRLAKEAAIAAANVLHEEDKVGVVAFNHEARIVLELTKAKDLDAITRRVSRLRAGGGTLFYKALERVEELLADEPLAIKHVILLSDGESRGDRPLKPLITRMAAEGITLSTVGCGRSFDADRLSDMALWGRGKFQPAFSAQEIPEIFTIEVERVIKRTGARRRTPPQPRDPYAQKAPGASSQVAAEKEAGKEAEEEKEELRPRPIRRRLPAPYTRGITPESVQGVLGLHPASARRGAWVALETDAGEAVLAHGFRGDGRVIALTLPLEGRWARLLEGWDDYQVLAARMIRFLMPDGDRERFHLLATRVGRSVFVRVHDRRDRHLPPRGTRLSFRDEEGRPVDAPSTRVAEDLWRVDLPPEAAICALDLSFRLEGQEGEGVGFIGVPPPPEIAGRGVDLLGLRAWADALGGEIAESPPVGPRVPEVVGAETVPAGRTWFAWALLLACADLLLKRLVPGRARERRRASA